MKSKLIGTQVTGLNYDFRKTFWGMTRSEVKLSENAYPLGDNESHVIYEDEFLHLESKVGFHFMNDRLIEAGYAFSEVYSDLALYIREYERVKLNLCQYYGKPVLQKDYSAPCHSNSCYNNQDKNVEMYIVQWLSSRSIIRLLFISDKSSTEFGVLHISRDYQSTLSASIN